MTIRRIISHKVRNFLFSTVNGEFLIFLFFLCLSGIFWLLMPLNITYEREFKVPVRIVNVPENVVLTSDETDTIRVVLRDKGLVLVRYYYGKGLKPLDLNFKSYARDSKGTTSVGMAELARLLSMQLSASTRIVTTKNEKVDIFYNYGKKKNVPVKWHGNVVPEQMYFISNVEYLPDSVLVYASDEQLDIIQAAVTEPIDVSNFRDTLTVECKIKKIKGVKFVPEMVKVKFMTDVLTEESIGDIPVTGINVPEGKVLRTFPSKVTVKFVTGVNQFRKIEKKDFVVVADYNDVAKGNSEKCKIQLRSVPHGVSRASISVKEVDYLIEEE